MLSVEDNEMLTRVGAGTPMGELFRRFWLPALVTTEIPDHNGPPVRLRLLGEDLVAFRDSTGRVGIIGAQCPHRRAPLFFGRNEESGLRCAYHGWKFDVEGTCVDMPNEPPERQFKQRIKQVAYPAREQGGVVWVYMGPAAVMPDQVPQFEWVAAPEGHQFVARWLQRSNWCQGMEGEIDTSHISFLHSMNEVYNPDALVAQSPSVLEKAKLDGAPKLSLLETPYGFNYGSRRAYEDHYYWRVTRWLFPMYSLIPGTAHGGAGRAWVPVDDEHTYTFHYQCRDDRPFNEDEIAQFYKGGGFPPRAERRPYRLPDGGIIDAWVPTANLDNDYLIDRDMQRDVNFTGIWGVNEQDRSLQEGMRPIVDRSKEHLGTADIAILSARRLLINMAKKLLQGVEPTAPHEPQNYNLRPLEVFDPQDDFRSILEKYDATLGAAAF
ncbi:MAG: phthalate 4,5-dioxygenase [Pseudonocardiales bacterium]|jgi:phthalate 4,5-dioxygenase oxygenase subunit|nr:phthalate 4,5-dioxygenase [Pseudonocardiales bacterium]